MIFNMAGGGAVTDAPIIGTDFTWTGGDGTYQVLDDGDGNWRIKFLASGTFTPLRDMRIDVFCVGGGGGKGLQYAGGGGAGYTTTVKSVVVTANTAYPIVVGAAGANGVSGASDGTNGGDSVAFNVTAFGGKGTAYSNSSSSRKPGGNGGSGGGSTITTPGYLIGAGGVDGGDGESVGTQVGGTGQGTTTREFGEATGDLYATGGGNVLQSTEPNSGNGGGRLDKDTWVAPADGIVVIRQHKEDA